MESGVQGRDGEREREIGARHAYESDDRTDETDVDRECTEKLWPSCGRTAFYCLSCCCPSRISGSRECNFEGIWSYRRARVGSGGDASPAGWAHIYSGDITQQNWGNPSGNDLYNAYLLAPLSEARASVRNGGYHGGVNLTALRMLEQRAYGWNTALREAAPSAIKQQLVLSRASTGTGMGLAKVPYLRGSRRAVGLDGFVLRHASEVATRNTSSPPQAAGTSAAVPPLPSNLGERFHDRVGLGNYNADIHATGCSPPLHPYLSHGAPTVPFYLPFRALTHEGSANLLVAGKLMATSFFANAATRLHPSEWSSGIAAGGAAVLMHQRG